MGVDRASVPKRNSILSILILGLTFTVFAIPASQAGPFGPSADTKRNVAAIEKLFAAEKKLLTEWNSVIGPNYQDDYSTGVALIKLLPKVNVFIGKLDALTSEDKKLQSAINLWIDGWNKQAEGIALTISAIDQQDFALIAKANAATAAGRKIIKRTQQAFAPFLKK